MISTPTAAQVGVQVAGRHPDRLARAQPDVVEQQRDQRTPVARVRARPAGGQLGVRAVGRRATTAATQLVDALGVRPAQQRPHRRRAAPRRPGRAAPSTTGASAGTPNAASAVGRRRRVAEAAQRLERRRARPASPACGTGRRSCAAPSGRPRLRRVAGPGLLGVRVGLQATAAASAASTFSRNGSRVPNRSTPAGRATCTGSARDQRRRGSPEAGADHAGTGAPGGRPSTAPPPGPRSAPAAPAGRRWPCATPRRSRGSGCTAAPRVSAPVRPAGSPTVRRVGGGAGAGLGGGAL